MNICQTKGRKIFFLQSLPVIHHLKKWNPTTHAKHPSRSSPAIRRITFFLSIKPNLPGDTYKFGKRVIWRYRRFILVPNICKHPADQYRFFHRKCCGYLSFNSFQPSVLRCWSFIWASGNWRSIQVQYSTQREVGQYGPHGGKKIVPLLLNSNKVFSRT